MKNCILVLFMALSSTLLQGCGDARWLDCIDGCSHYRDGKDGAPGVPGTPGQDGSDGHNAVIKVNSIPDASVLPSSVCPAGGYEYISATDLNDNGLPEVTETNYNVSVLCNGVAGQDGADGQDGQDGQDGADGADAPPTPYTMVGMIDPCGKQGSNNAPDEVFILLANGQLIASFSANSNGNMTRFSSLIPNANSSFSGGTTDQTGCGITISRDNANNVTLTTSNGLGQASWVLVP